MPTIRRASAAARRALRLPLHGGFDPMAEVTCDIPFIARRAERTPAEVRRPLGGERGPRLILGSFGAYGVELPDDALRRQHAFEILRVGERVPHGLAYQDLWQPPI